MIQVEHKGRAVSIDYSRAYLDGVADTQNDALYEINFYKWQSITHKMLAKKWEGAYRRASMRTVVRERFGESGSLV